MRKIQILIGKAAKTKIQEQKINVGHWDPQLKFSMNAFYLDDMQYVL